MPTVDVAKIDSNFLDRLRIDEFFAEYANCLDEDNLEAWPGFFIADCTYGIWPRENADADLPMALFYCRNQNMLKDRVIAHRQVNFFPLHWNRHFISAIKICEKRANEFIVRSNYLIVQTRQDGVSFIHQTGIAHDRIVDLGGELKFAERKIIYDTLRVQTLFVTPV